MKTLIIGPNRFGIGIDVGWRNQYAEGGDWDVWWGNTKDEATLASLINDAHNRYGDFAVLRLSHGKQPE